MRVCHIQYMYYPWLFTIDMYQYIGALSQQENNIHIDVIGRKAEKHEGEVNNVQIEILKKVAEINRSRRLQASEKPIVNQKKV